MRMGNKSREISRSDAVQNARCTDSIVAAGRVEPPEGSLTRMAIQDRSISRHAPRPLFDSRIFGQGLRYMLAGVVVTLVYLLTTAALSDIVGIPVQVSLIAGFTAAVGIHFILQRLFVWARSTPFVLGVRKQMGRYALVVVCQYGVTAVSTSLLPGALGVPAVAIYLTVPFVLTTVNFIIFQSRVFHTADERIDTEESPPAKSNVSVHVLSARSASEDS